MHPRTVVMLVVGFFGGLTFAACGTANTCSPATCGGCCDQTGKCQGGSTADTCGTNGASCGRCGTGTVCQSGECRASSMGGGSGGGSGGGNGGGTTGGGSGGGITGGGMGGGTTTGGGTGGGTTGGGAGGGTTGGGTGGGVACRQITALQTDATNLSSAEYRAFTSGNSHYNYAGFVYLTAGDPDGFRIEVVYPGDVAPSLPYTETFTAATRYQNCTACALFYESCNAGTSTCAHTYLAQGGSMTVTRADRANAGRLIGSATALRFNEWDLASDTADGTRCVIVNSAGPWNVGWNTDGGMPPP